MNAYIYAAGRGLRLGPELGRRPKVLLEIGGRSLLEWHACRLAEVGVSRVYVVVGYEAASIERVLPSLQRESGLPFVPILNPDFNEGSVLSFAASLPDLRNETEPVLLMDGDVFYAPSLLPKLVNSGHRTALLIDRAYSTADDDPVLVPVRNGRPVDFRKRWTGQADLVGESIGFFKIDPADLPRLEQETLRRTRGQGRMESYDEVLRDLVMDGLFGHEDVTGTPWTELDFPSDVEYALNHVLPLVDSREPASEDSRNA